jgi:hypothetical protein
MRQLLPLGPSLRSRIDRCGTKHGTAHSVRSEFALVIQKKLSLHFVVSLQPVSFHCKGVLIWCNDTLYQAY